MPAPGHYILVEGKDDEHVLVHTCIQNNLHLDPDIKQFGGWERLRESLPVRLKAAVAEDVIAIIVDADTDLDSRWMSLKDQFVRLGFQDVPESPHSSGTVLESDIEKNLPRIGIWIMPNNQTPGILEDFVRFLVPAGDPLLDHAMASVDSIPSGLKRFPEVARTKAHLHTWLAWQEQPGKPLGLAIKQKVLDSSVPEARAFVAWLRRLFEKSENA